MSFPPSFKLREPKNEMLSDEVPKKNSFPPSFKLRESNTFPFEGENDLDREIERNIAQQTSRMGEAIIGAPGNIWSFAKSIFGFDEETNLPTSKSLREKSEELSQGYTKPKNEFEERIGEVQQDIASFLVPGSRQYSMFRNIGIPIVANLAKEGVNIAGSEKLGESAKVGLMIGLDLMSQRKGGAKKFAGSLFEQMDEKIPKGRSISTKNLIPNLNELEKELSQGGSKPSTVKALEKIKELKRDSEGGKIDLRNLAAYRPAINEAIDDLGGFEYIMKPKQKQKIINNLQKVKKEVIKSVEEYADNFDPELLKLSRNANEAWAVYENSNKIGKFLEKYFGKKALGLGVKTLLGIGAPSLGAGIFGIGITAAATPILASGYQGIKILNRVKNSPTLRKYYADVLKSALIGNVSQTSRSLKALDKELEEEED